MKHNVRIILKNGYSFVFACEDFKVKWINGEMTEYSFKGAVLRYPLYIRISDISAIIDEGAVAEEEC